MNHYRGRHRVAVSTGRVVMRGAVATGVAAASVALAVPAHADVLDAIAACESGGNIRATNPTSTASGKYQFIDGTWRGLGGAGRAKDASEAVQDAMARKLLAQAGTAPWNASRACWSKRGGVAAAAGAPAPVRKATPAPRAPQRPAQAALSGSYVVRAGDTLGGIAAQHNRDWRALWQANRATVPNPNLIYPGERLTLA